MSAPRVAPKKVISITYTIRDQKDDTLLEAVEVPVDYLHGDRSLWDKVEEALEGRGIGERIEVTLSPEEGFGEWDQELTFSDAIENVPPEYRRVGAEAEFHNEEGDAITMKVTAVDKETVTLDGNHPFAGKTVIFAVEVQAIRDATPDELKNGIQEPSLH